MKATISKTVDGYKVFTNKESDNFEQYMLNLGAVKRADHYFLWTSNAGRNGQFIKELLLDEGYDLVENEQL